jgi:uncharacterized membrane protein
MTTLVLGLILFLGVHSVSNVSSEFRNRCAAALGETAWRGLYALISIVGLVLLVRGYGIAREAPVLLYAPPQWIKDWAVGLMIFVFPLLLAAYLPGRIRSAMRGNPMLVATKLWATLHLAANGALADVVLFGSILAWAVVTRISLKFRTPRPVPGAPPSPWNDAIAVVGGLALYAIFILGGHLWLIGVPAYARWP